MSMHKISLLGDAIPDSGGNAYAAPYSLEAGSAPTDPNLDPMVWMFPDSGAKDGVRGAFVVPENYVSGSKLKIYWTSATNSNNVQFDVHYLVAGDGDDIGAAATDDTDTVSVSAPATADQLQIDEMTLTEGDFVPGELVLFSFFRDSATDSHADTVVVFEVDFEYSDAA